MPVVSASFNNGSAGAAKQMLQPAGGKPFLRLTGENGEKLIYRQDSIKKLYNNDSKRYEDSMQKFEEERRAYANAVHYLIIKQRGGTTQKKKSKVGGFKELPLKTNK